MKRAMAGTKGGRGVEKDCVLNDMEEANRVGSVRKSNERQGHPFATVQS